MQLDACGKARSIHTPKDKKRANKQFIDAKLRNYNYWNDGRVMSITIKLGN